ncbi:hypothetical protein BpHYR1_047347 [Brachionus plicatilis]|uniref:Uncharacterized protein n=1 Tax=Brachionus plicatilis TaxID=10195 RepID=A0A3M7SQJ5_BRAPC|nr:hypothetical protein BpHYR1_047347 [Brachionus plicatilis]
MTCFTKDMTHLSLKKFARNSSRGFTIFNAINQFFNESVLLRIFDDSQSDLKNFIPRNFIEYFYYFSDRRFYFSNG